MNGDRTIMVEILNAIEYGNLSVDETRRRLERLIDIEIEKTDAPANKPLVEECEKLLWELNTNGKLPFVSHLEENQSAVLRDFRNHQNLRMFGKYALRIGIVAAALFVFAIGAEVLLHREWLDTTTSSDGEQFIIYGEAVKPGLIEEGTAVEDTQTNQRMTTANLDDATAFLGIDFQFPDNTVAGWDLSYYECIKTRRKAKLLGYYTMPTNPENTLIIDATYFSDIQDAHLEFEQNEKGRAIEYHSIKLYIAENLDKKQYMWMQGPCVYSVGGHISLDEVKGIISQILGE